MLNTSTSPSDYIGLYPPSVANIDYNKTMKLQLRSFEIKDDDNDGSPVTSEAGMSFSIPGFLRKVFTKEFGDNNGVNHKLLAVAVHAVLLESGFVQIDPVSNQLENNNSFNATDNWYLAAFYYTLPDTIIDDGNIETVKIKFQNLGMYCKVYGSLVNGTSVHSLLLDEDKLVSVLNLVWANCGPEVATLGKNNKMSMVQPEKEVFEFWKKVKDWISLPLLIDLCEKTGLRAPPCFMQLPTELKLKILESVSGVEIAKLSCVCSELRYLASSDDLWKQKYVEQFWGVIGFDSLKNFKERFAKTYVFKNRNSFRRSRRYGRNPYPPYFVGFPRILDGDYDLGMRSVPEW